MVCWKSWEEKLFKKNLAKSPESGAGCGYMNNSAMLYMRIW